MERTTMRTKNCRPYVLSTSPPHAGEWVVLALDQRKKPTSKRAGDGACALAIHAPSRVAARGTLC